MLTPFSEYLFDYDRNCILCKRDTVECLDSVFGYRNISAGSDLHVRQLWTCAISLFTREASSGVNDRIEGSLQQSIQNTAFNCTSTISTSTTRVFIVVLCLRDEGGHAQ